jgi:manganese oxidase
VQKIQRHTPDYMVMGERGMADMGEMEMELPANTFPMMTGTGPYGPIEMGGMFTTLKVRADQKPGDHSDPGWYAMPPGTQAREVPTPGAASRAPSSSTPDPQVPAAASARKPAGPHHH